MNRRVARIVMIAAVASSAACSSMTPPFLLPAPQRDWNSTLDRGLSLAATGRAPEADSMFASFVAAYPTSAGAREALYWRSVIQLQSGIVSENGPAMLLDRYLGYSEAEHKVEATSLRRIAVRVDSLSRAATMLSTRVQTSNGEVVAANNRAADAKSDAKAATADNKDQDAEIKRLRGELAAAKEELERIKKRLAEPAKKPPR